MRFSLTKLPGLSAMLGMLLVAACAAGTPEPAALVAGKISPETTAAAQALAEGHLPAAPARSDSSGRLQVYIYVSQPTADTVTVLTAHGVSEAILSPGLGLIEGWVNPGDLANISALSFVTRVTLPRYARPQ